MKQFDLKNGSVFVLVEAAGGVYNADALARVCAVADAHSAFLKATEDHRIGFMVGPEALEEVTAELRSHGLLARPYRGGGAPSPRACLGELCPHAEQDALGDAIELATALSARFGDDERPFATVGLNGCHRACIASGLDDIHIVGEESGYKITVGGKAREIPQLGQFVADNVPKERLAEAVAALLDTFYANVAEDEALVDVVERIGLSDFSDPVESLLTGSIMGAGANDAGALVPEQGDGAIEGNLGDVEEVEVLDEDSVVLDDAGGDPDGADGADGAGGAIGRGVVGALDVGLDTPGNLGNQAGDSFSEEPESEGGATGTLDALRVDASLEAEPSGTADFDDVPLEGEADASFAFDADGNGPSAVGGNDAYETSLESREPAGSDIGVGDLEEETDIDDAGIMSGTRAFAPVAQVDATSDDERDLMAEEEGLDIEDASAEDLARVTSAIRAEVEPDEDPAPSEPGLGIRAEADVDTEILAFEETRRTPEPRIDHSRERAADRSRAVASVSSLPSHNGHGGHGTHGGPGSHGGRRAAPGGLSVRLDGGALGVTLSDGTTFRCPLARGGTDGLVLELRTSDGTLSVERHGGVVAVELGEMSLELPVDTFESDEAA